MMWDLARGSQVGAPSHLTCGGCGAAIRVGDPVGFLTRARLPRCASCVKRQLGETPPADLHQVVAPPTPPAPTWVRVTRSEVERALPFDVKAAQVGER